MIVVTLCEFGCVAVWSVLLCVVLCFVCAVCQCMSVLRVHLLRHVCLYVFCILGFDVFEHGLCDTIHVLLSVRGCGCQIIFVVAARFFLLCSS